MKRFVCAASVAASVCLASLSAQAEDIDSLKGQFTFNWHAEPGKQRCKAVGDTLLAAFKSDAYSCDMKIVTNTASGEPARTCTQKGEGAEYLIFASKTACEAERKVQDSNAE